MKISFSCCVFALLLFSVSSIHLQVIGGMAGRIVMRAYSDTQLQQAVKKEYSGTDKTKLKSVIAQKIAEFIKKDPKSLQRLANASFPAGTIGRISLTKQQKEKLLMIAIQNPHLFGITPRGAFLRLIQKQDSLKNIYDELSQRRRAFLEVRQKLIPKVKADPLVAPYIANNTAKSDPEYRRVFKVASAKIIKADSQLQKVVAKSRFGFDPVFSKLSQDQRVKLLNILLDDNKTLTLRWKSPQYLRAVSEAIQKEPTLKEFYDKNKDDIENKIKSAEERKKKWLDRSRSHLR